jgi:hypothetical protein
MEMKTMIKLSSLAAFVLCAGCATSKPALQGQLDAQLGAAVKANIAAHAVEPTPEQKANTFIPANPARTGLALKQYRENTVPNPVSTGAGN